MWPMVVHSLVNSTCPNCYLYRESQLHSELSLAAPDVGLKGLSDVSCEFCYHISAESAVVSLMIVGDRAGRLAARHHYLNQSLALLQYVDGLLV